MSLPDYHHHHDFILRSQKLKELREFVEPYPHDFKPSDNAGDILKKYADDPIGHSEDAALGKTQQVKIAGRLMLFRAMGKNAFAHIQDDSSRIQLMFNRELSKLEKCGSSDEEDMKIIEKKIDLGDLLGVEGHLFRTNKGEITIFVKKATLLSKTLLPLPDKHSGLTDKEMRYRKRWLDLISHPEIKEFFKKRSQIFRIIRSYFEKSGFIEVETPILQNTYGGAEARPFTTHLNALDQEMFLRISLEIPLKKLIVGGMERIYEIGKVFRNEGIDKTHNPEFTELEAYAAYWDYNDMMEFTENLFETIALELYGTTKIPGTTLDGSNVEIDLKAPWKKLSMKGAIKEYLHIDVDQESEQNMKKLLKEKTDVVPKLIDEANRGLLIYFIFDELVSKQLIQPHHIIDHPIETTPLCKLHRDPQLRKEGFVERFESFILGKEMCNSYTELNDPQLQRELLVEQALKKEKGNEEAHPLDEEFIEAICQGMPPTGGVGIGLDRLIMIITNTPSIRDVLYFPIMKPHHTE